MYAVTVDNRFTIQCGSREAARIVARYFALMGLTSVTRGV